MKIGTGLPLEGFNAIHRRTKAYTTATQAQESDTSNISREKITFMNKNRLFFSNDIFDSYLLLSITSFQLET